jgi:hypothetical protein
VALQHRQQPGGEGLQRERGDLEGGGGRLVGGVEEVAAEGVGGGEGDGVQHAVDRAPASRQLLADRSHVGRLVDVQLQDVHLAGQPARGPLGEGAGAAEPGEHHLGPVVQGLAGHRVGDRAGGQHPGDQQSLAVDQHGSVLLVYGGRPPAF